MKKSWINDDCFNFFGQLKAASVDLILTDPPYGITQQAWDSAISVAPLLAHFDRIIKPQGVILIFVGEPLGSHLRLNKYIPYRYDWIWEKGEATGYLNSKKRPLVAHENIVVLYKKQPVYYPQMTDGHTRKVSKQGDPRTGIYGEGQKKVGYDSTSRYPRSVLRFKKDKQKEHFHPNQKPVALLEYLIKSYTAENALVFDCFMGSGSTGVAALRCGRRFIGVEKDFNYYETAEKRLSTT